jgi:hypothetical protein
MMRLFSFLGLLAQSLRTSASANIESLLLECSFHASAWTLANLYLASIGAELLGKDAPRLVGLSEETTCYVSPEYFLSQDEPFDDFVVHEAAHIFHNCRRAAVGFRETRRKEWLLDIEYRKRETFAYSCEAYARVIKRGKNPVDRGALAEQYARTARISDERVDAAEVAGIIRAASEVRNGWKLILARCAPSRLGRHDSQEFTGCNFWIALKIRMQPNGFVGECRHTVNYVLSAHSAPETPQICSPAHSAVWRL